MTKKAPIIRKRIITDTITDVSPYELECSFADLRKRVDEWIDQYGENARLAWDAHFYYDYDSNPSPRFNIMCDREETDEEIAIRVAKERQDKDLAEERDRAEFKRLQKKFQEKK